MNIVQLISQKRDGAPLTKAQIEWMVLEFAKGEMAPEQMSAMAMAIFFRDMSLEETSWLTQAMIDSGEPLTWSNSDRPRLDKHSTGGIGDKISIPLTPLLAELGLDVPMISGRGLGPTGGTLDKLESIPGFNVYPTTSQMQAIVRELGCVIVGANKNLAPVDQKLYALRDVTGTVPSVPLITASILSKKLSEGLNGLVMDVKWGTGAFMKTPEKAHALAERIVSVAKQMGVPTRALITDMNQPLGRMIGNACEMQESLDILQGQGPTDVRLLTLELAAEALLLMKMDSDKQSAFNKAAVVLDSGAAYDRFERMVDAQGGRLADFDRTFARTPVELNCSGYVAGFDAEKLGFAIIEMGGGRKQQKDQLNLRTGLEVLVRIGDKIEAGQPWIHLLNFNSDNPDVMRLLAESIVISNENRKPIAPSLVLQVVA